MSDRVVSLRLQVGARSLTANGPNSNAEFPAYLEAMGGCWKSGPPSFY